MASAMGSASRSGRILIVTAAELTEDPRARRTAEEAARHGLAVQGLCISDGPGIGGIEVLRVPAMHLEQRARAAGVTRVARSSKVARELRGVYRLWRHAWLTGRYVRAASAVAACDIVHTNDFDTLPAGAILARRWNARLVYDSHELYTLQEPDPPRLYCAVVRRVEGRLARRSDAVITVNAAYAASLEETHRLTQPPHLVMNCPPVVADVEPHGDGQRVRAIYQAANGPGRRVDDLLDAAPHAGEAGITIRVVGADLDALRRRIAADGLGERVELAPPVRADRLVEEMAGFDIGLIINRPITPNDELVLPNKLFEYMMAGLAVVAPDLPIVGGFVEREQVGLTYPAGDTAAMGRAIRQLAEDPQLLQSCRVRARQLAVETYNAEAQVEELTRAWGIAA
ncbi:MAG TPA: glycosyltransferase [Gaiellaceae bacterium]|jgi:glycosyltransferase involved in cell wall biosynthesis|nr:glycosyltransferase [Gaiellaceae bacterium]